MTTTPFIDHFAHKLGNLTLSFTLKEQGNQACINVNSQRTALSQGPLPWTKYRSRIWPLFTCQKPEAFPSLTLQSTITHTPLSESSVFQRSCQDYAVFSAEGKY